MKVKRIIFKIVHYCFPQLLYKKTSYSQDGEDMMVQTYYETEKHYKGFYVDVGAHHPYRFSNTAYFYGKGWRGINIEPSPTLFRAFQRYRKKDININVGVSSCNSSFPFYVFNDQALNTFDEKIAQERNISNSRYKIVSRIDVQTCTLKDIFEKYISENKQHTYIDFLSVDVEGLDLDVLKSNDWNKFQPGFILVECEANLENISQDEIYLFLKEKDYNLIGRTKRTSLFRHNGNAKF